jgi:hypothetical protein
LLCSLSFSACDEPQNKAESPYPQGEAALKKSSHSCRLAHRNAAGTGKFTMMDAMMGTENYRLKHHSPIGIRELSL